jgi:CheY-like chemotaxis protein
MITVDSEVGYGTTFNIYLLKSDKEAHQEVAPTGKIIQGSETIPLVDDEEMIIDVSKAILEKLGYRVVIAKGGEPAIDAVKRIGEDIDLVILDLIMPGMDGSKVFDRIREIKPNMPVILSSGYSLNDQADDILQRGCNGFIQKPFNISKLSQKVRKILDKAKS